MPTPFGEFYQWEKDAVLGALLRQPKEWGIKFGFYWCLAWDDTVTIIKIPTSTRTIY